MEVLDWNTVLQPFLGVFVLIILMIIMVILYKYIRIWLVILIVFLFSLIIGVNSLALEYIPFNPYLSIFFILFQSCFFIVISIETYKI